TERPETIDCGSNILSGADPVNILRSTVAALNKSCAWKPPKEYLARCVSKVVEGIILAQGI
ncbi:MAG: UDP-N-acetylglucosamine 2-epimerase (non-hydrolyzing), partial [Thermoplasmata archaeon]|nr:UDP-N-acetylglucosamine 2-epimerase (non-hydrolyzing) [Thermoplasmata archaeon]